MEENNTGGWVAPTHDAWGLSDFAEVTRSMLQIPQVSIDRGGISFPMPSLSAVILPMPRRRWYWWPKTIWYVLVRQYGRDEGFHIGPFHSFDDAKRVHQDFYAWYSSVYNVIIRTYKATERNRK